MTRFSSAVPLYSQLEDVLRARIISGELSQGEQLPPLPALSSEFGMSLGTVRQALFSLEQEGLIVRRQGKGSFVAGPRIPQDLSLVSSSSSYRTVLGNKLSTQLLSVEILPANRLVAERLAVPEQTDVVVIGKLKLDEGEPFFLSTSYLERSAFPAIELEDHESALLDLLTDKYHVAITEVQGWLEPVLTADLQSRLLKVKRRSPAMLYDRVRYSGSKPVMYARHIIRGDRCRLHFRQYGGN